ncbi:AAA family ATPase [Desmonostoc muscorum LEGE 12446]|uniref:AAA family ATPase n=1 Tax=Desmonostoc muscorum LEGE 12446 TaxID=1828758 RepID=A0A8J6ZV69_DESMC|nr:AAA family ATPase [Desmonostoc muscorum]MCF2151605.1 AAA family ATPase [Desmonostoc muscorum LEGE 12446]
MWISEINLNNFRCFSNTSIELSKGINLIVGSNNSGKSSLLKSILWLQRGFSLDCKDLRISQNSGYVQVWINEVNQDFLNRNPGREVLFKLNILRNTTTLHLISDLGDTFFTSNDFKNEQIFNEEPRNFIYPYLSKRKVAGFHESINLSAANSVRGDLYNLYAKIDRISNPQMPANEQYVQACEDIIGFQVTSTPSPNGKQAAYIVSNQENIPLDAMGEGVANLVGLIVDLCMAENQLFLIEEPENDVHPKALKKLLNFITEKSVNNQFIITTHSNIVAKYLGAHPNSKLFSVSMEFQNRLPTSHIEEIDNTPEARRHVLEELGYDFFDFDLWSAWLILEESSAERIIRDYLIPWFSPELKGRLRTYSANSLSEVETKFRDFDKLFVFLHMQPIYKNLAWVVVDAGEEEAKIIEKLKSKYTRSGWNESNFLQFCEHDFERYYPAEFQLKVDTVVRMPPGQHRQKSKDALRQEVMTWIDENPNKAKDAFQDSASDVIQVLQCIQSYLSINSSSRFKSNAESHS